MAKEAKKDDVPTLNIITPKGVAIYPRLNKPDTKFNVAGVYDCRLRLDPEDPEVASLVEKLTKLRDKFHKDLVADLTKKKKSATVKKLKIRDIGTPDVNDEDEETGLIVLKGKTIASGTYSDGKAWKRAPVIFDAKGNKLKDPPLIYGGSELKMACLAKPYLMKSSFEVGVTLYLNAVQIIKLVSGGGPQDAEGFGFSEEDGYEADDTDGSGDMAGESEESEGAGSDDDIDF